MNNILMSKFLAYNSRQFSKEHPKAKTDRLVQFGAFHKFLAPNQNRPSLCEISPVMG
ncbi:MAG: hypothetical protein MN733_37740 [Nitrososphaera sp.]|nr:hypothetical protein [Nitrososphaera sp.]